MGCRRAVGLGWSPPEGHSAGDRGCGNDLAPLDEVLGPELLEPDPSLAEEVGLGSRW